MIASVLGSDEFIQSNGALSKDDFVKLLYRQILRREASIADIAYQVAHITDTQSRITMVNSFLSSEEFRLGTGPQVTAFLLYATLLLRDASPAELNLRAEQIKAGTPLRIIVEDFINSSEFQSLFK